MSALTDRIAQGNALVGYLPIGFPTLDAGIEAAVRLVEGGADVLELGIPYSDPVMDGLVIQEATEIALAGGFRLADVFRAVRAVTERVDVPVLVMTYWNPVVQYGVERFAADLKAAGGAGLITPDLTPDEAAEWIRVSDQYELDRVFLAAPSSSDARLTRVIESSRGFVYAVSTMGITGARSDVDAAARALVSRLRDLGATNVCVGVGISSAEHVADVCSYASGAIVGSALVKALGIGGPDAVGSLAAELAVGATA
ncbi:MAG TPA: tryptophan synthase subunit alpha [Microbacteriaceae bacterium]|nr:tryptophan synthase subunit alpha [Microbacteriaceae bacterium]